MSNILIVNAMKEFGPSQGELNKSLSDIAEDLLVKAGHRVKSTIVDKSYNIEDEIEKILWSDSIIYQMPSWWMGPPWTLKKYIDEVFTTGHGRLYKNDGRTRSDPTKTYGTGGLMNDKTYMISVTWNAPIQAFTEPTQFFGGVGVDTVYLHFHKAHQFIGMKQLPTFMFNDVVKKPTIVDDIEKYRQHLTSVFVS